MKSIGWRDMPRFIASDGQRIRRAGAKTLNALAFDSLPEIVQHASRRLKIRTNARRALGMRVAKRATPTSLVSLVATDRGWLFFHLNEGRRTAKDSTLTSRGTRWLMAPIEDRAFTKKGRLKRSYARRAFVAGSGRTALLVYRPRRGDAIPIATLGRSFRHHKELSPEEVVDDIIRRKGGRLFRIFMDKEIRRAR